MSMPCHLLETWGGLFLQEYQVCFLELQVWNILKLEYSFRVRVCRGPTVCRTPLGPARGSGRRKNIVILRVCVPPSFPSSDTAHDSNFPVG